jgi:N-acyl-D-amino-acid deacylase
MQYDLKIVGGTIVDGTGAPGRLADLGIAGGRITAIGEAPGGAREVIDATGKVVCPGFIDIHTHYDAQILWDRSLSISPWHGVTTVVIGNCGFGIAPARPEHRSLLVRTLEKVEGMSVEALEAGLGQDWGFESFPQYLDLLEAGGTAINVAAMIGHTPLRLYVMGRDAAERAATPDEVGRMRALAQEALEAGALGIATSKLSTHVGFEGRPVPSRLAGFDEVRAIASAIPVVGHGIIQTTLGPGLLFDELEQLARETGAPICWTALLAGFAFSKSSHRDLLDRNAALMARGIAITPQVSPRPLNFEFQFREPFALEGMSLFKPVSAAPFDEKRRLYQDPGFRAAFRERWDSAWPELRHSFQMMVVTQFDPDPSLEERLAVEVAAQRGVHPVDLVLDMALATQLEARFRMPLANHDESAVAELLQDPRTVVGLSDAGAHANQLCDACQATDLLGRWVREKGVLSLENAVRMLTSRPADVFGIKGRGRLAAGLAADVVVFDPATVAAGPLRRVRDLPGNADRLVSDAIGVEAVVVNGTVIRQAGVDRPSDGQLPGRLLRKGAAPAAA